MEVEDRDGGFGGLTAGTHEGSCLASRVVALGNRMCDVFRVPRMLCLFIPSCHLCSRVPVFPCVYSSRLATFCTRSYVRCLPRLASSASSRSLTFAARRASSRITPSCITCHRFQSSAPARRHGASQKNPQKNTHLSLPSLHIVHAPYRANTCHY